jgi:hypothetical protein
MEQLNSNLVQTVASFMKGKRLEKFNASVTILNESLAQGAWTKRGSVKSSGGVYQGLLTLKQDPPTFELMMCLRFGHECRVAVTAEMIEKNGFGHIAEVVGAWVQLCSDVAHARRELDAARPLPVVTAIGLSPKVTKTFQECNLDIDVSSIKPAPIKSYQAQMRSQTTGELMFDKRGEPIMETIYYVAWPKGTQLHKSRFAYSGCEACGKNIPSGRYVAIEADCRKLGHIGLYVGCDCAHNIFGVKDLGIDKNAAAPE